MFKIISKQILSSNIKSYEVQASDIVILALGLNPNPVLPSLTKGLGTDSHGYLIINDKFMTKLNGIFAGGSTVIEAMGMGKQATKNIHIFLNTNTI
jgi:glutamate synthase (NADPH/NADH) small chain